MRLCSLGRERGSTQPAMATAASQVPARSRSADRPAISARRLVRSRRAAVPLGPGRHGDRPEILHYLAVCLSQRGALGDAEALWRKAIAKDPNEPMLSYNLGLVARRLGQPRRGGASASATPSAARRPMSRRGWRWPASISTSSRFAAAERELSEVVANLDRALEQPDGAQLRPMQARARNMLGHVALSPRPLRAGARGPRQALRDAGEDAARRAQILGDRALALGGLGRHDEAIAEAEQALALAPHSASLNHVLGFVLYFAGRVAEAIAPIEKALELDPDFHAGAQDAGAGPGGRRQGRRGRRRAAAGAAPESARSRRRPAALLPAYRAQALRRSAARRWSPISRRRPTMCAALNNQGLALRGLKRFDEARRALKRASRLSTDDPLVLTNLGARAGRSRPRRRSAVAARACAARPAGRCAAARQLRRLPGRAGREATRRARPWTPRWRPIPTTTKRWRRAASLDA